MFDPERPSDMKDFHESYKYAQQQLEGFRKIRKRLVDDFVGAEYKGDSENQGAKMPVNMLALTNDIYLMHLAGNNPRVLLTTAKDELAPFAADLEAVLNQELQDMNFAKTLRRWIQEALFGGLGIIKCGLVDGDYIEIIPGQPQASQEYFADIVDMADFSFDPDARTLDSATWMSDRYLADYEQVMDGDYGEIAKKAVQPTDKISSYDVSDNFHPRSISSGDNIQVDRKFKPSCFLIDVWLPEEGILMTIPESPEPSAPLRTLQWEGPSHGPYHKLSFIDVPGNAMPMSTMGLTASLNRLINATWRKITQQAERQKDLGLYRRGAQDDAKEIQKANDGDMVGLNHTDGFIAASLGGVKQENLALTIQLDQVFGKMAGNLDSLGGLGPQSDTAKQDAMINQQSSKKSANMATAAVDATAKLIKDLMFYVWNDPARIYRTNREVSGTNVVVEVQLEPDNRQGKIEEFNLSITPYSMQYRAPRERSSELTQIMTQMIFPMLPFLQQMGVGVDMQTLINYVAKYNDLPELNRLFMFTGPPQRGLGSNDVQQDTKHTNEVTSRPGATPQGNAQTMMAGLMGQARQASEQNAIGRPTGV